jgi:hypothetical protein
MGQKYWSVLLPPPTYIDYIHRLHIHRTTYIHTHTYIHRLHTYIHTYSSSLTSPSHITTSLTPLPRPPLVVIQTQYGGNIFRAPDAYVITLSLAQRLYKAMVPFAMAVDNQLSYTLNALGANV